jgi:hypothetical protein
MERVAAEAKDAPTRIGFVMALRLIRDEWMWTSGTSTPGAVPGHLRRLREDIARFILPERRARSQPRAVKIKMSNDPRKRPSVAASLLVKRSRSPEHVARPPTGGVSELQRRWPSRAWRSSSAPRGGQARERRRRLRPPRAWRSWSAPRVQRDATCSSL